jgi:hypothetical protein
VAYRRVRVFKKGVDTPVSTISTQLLKLSMPRGKKTDPNIISKIVAALKVFPKRLNHDKIAQECGSSKDTVARTAKRLKSSGKNPLDTRDRTLTMRGKKADPSIVSQIEAELKLPNPLSLNIIARQCGVSKGMVDKIATRLRNSGEIPLDFHLALNLRASDLEEVCGDRRYDVSPSHITTHPQFGELPKVVSSEIRDKHTCRDRDQARKLQQAHAREGPDHHGVIAFPCGPDFDRGMHRDFLDVLRRHRDDKFTPIFQIPQRRANPQLAAKLIIESSGGQEMASAKRDPRIGDYKRQHATMEDFNSKLDKDIVSSEAKVTGLESDIVRTKEKRQKIREDLSRPRGRNKESAQVDLNLIEQEVQDLEKTLGTAEEILNRLRQDKQLTEKVLKAGSSAFEKLMKLSPYRAIVEPKLTSYKRMSAVLTLEGGGAQGVHGDSTFAGGSILQVIGERKQYLLVLINGFRAVCILNRIKRQRQAALTFVRELLTEVRGAAWVSQNFVEDRVWNYIGQRQLEKELGPRALYLVRWPLEEGDTLLVDNRTPHAGAASDGPDAFRLHWYAYVVDAAARIGVKDGDQEVVFDLLKHYPALCAYAQTSSPPVFWSP